MARSRTADLAVALPATRVWVPVALVTIVFFAWAGYGLMNRHATLWAADGAMLSVLIVAHSARTQHGWRPRAIVAACALLFVGFVVGGLLAGQPLAALPGPGLASLVGALVGLGVYTLRGLGGWYVPRDASEAVWLMVAIVAMCTVGVVLGTYPGAPPLLQGEPRDIIWVASRALAANSVGVNCLLPAVVMPRDHVLPRASWRWLAVYVLASAVCLGLPYAVPQPTLSWLFLIPAWAGGMMLRTRSAVAVMAALGALSMKFPFPSYSVPAFAAFLPPEAATDLGLAFASHVCLLLVVFRRRLSLLRRRTSEVTRATQAQAELLQAIFHGMSDGLILAEPADGRVRMANRAARDLLGAVPEAVNRPWASSIGLRYADESDDVAAILRPDPAAPASHCVVSAGPGGGPRRMQVTSRALGLADDPTTLVLFRDVTEEHREQRQLEAVAGDVADRLQGPLREVTLLMDRAERELDRDRPAGQATLDEALDAAEEMRLLIDDYLAYVVRRGADLAPVDVRLTDLLSDISAAYRARADGPELLAEAPHVVHVDPALARQLFVELTDSAAGVGGGGGRPLVRVASTTRPDGWVGVRIDDGGDHLVGADRSEAAGEAAGEADGEADGEEQGTPGPASAGLGVSRAIVARHGGLLTVSSTAGGTAFLLTLPPARGER